MSVTHVLSSFCVSTYILSRLFIYFDHKLNFTNTIYSSFAHIYITLSHSPLAPYFHSYLQLPLPPLLEKQRAPYLIYISSASRTPTYNFPICSLHPSIDIYNSNLTLSIRSFSCLNMYYPYLYLFLYLKYPVWLLPFPPPPISSLSPLTYLNLVPTKPFYLKYPL